MVAAPTDRMDEKTGTPNFVNGGLPPREPDPGRPMPQIYFGQNSPSYSIVGQPPGSTKNVEFDYPSTNGGVGRRPHDVRTAAAACRSARASTRLLYAVKLHDPNIFFSSDINSGSQLLTVRDPRTRVAKVAPWLTLDGDVYPAVVDGRVQWVVDGYTSTANYPGLAAGQPAPGDDQLADQRDGLDVSQPNTHGQLPAQLGEGRRRRLHRQGHALLLEPGRTSPTRCCRPGRTRSPASCSPSRASRPALLPHLRYPQDLFDVQRSLLTQYHVADPSDFYNGADFWKIPNDPTVAATNTLNGGGDPRLLARRSRRRTCRSPPTGDGAAEWALSSPMVTLNYRDLARPS